MSQVYILQLPLPLRLICTAHVTIHKNTAGRALHSRQDDEKPRKDQSLYIISAINMLVHLPRPPAPLLADAHFPLFYVCAVPHAVQGLAR